MKARFEESPDIFLTEEDVRSHLFAALLKNGFAVIKTTEDHSSSIELHSEVRWYGHQAKKRKYRSDIVLIDVSQLSTRGAAGYELPSKGYGFERFSGIIETKLRRRNGESDGALVRRIRADMTKLSNISSGVSREFVGHVVVFDKKKDVREKMPDNHGNIEVTYSFPPQRSRQLEQRLIS